MKNFKNLLFVALFFIAATVIGQTKISGNPSLDWSTIVPEIFVWPITVAAIKNKATNNKFLKFFIIEY